MKNLLVLIALCHFTCGFSQKAYDETAVLDFHNEINAQFSDSLTSPLLREDFQQFRGLDFFPPNANFFVIANFKRTPKEQPFEMKTSTDRLPIYVKYGEITFKVSGKQFKLNVYQNVELVQKEGFEDYLFLPFSNLTSGKETYVGGRYIDVKIPKGKTMVVDFNKAYNPYCAYNYKYSCPIVPLENDIGVPIYAGVKKFHD